MKPKLQPIAFPRECTPYGEHAFQPLVLPEQAYAVTGGPNALFLIEMHSPPNLALTIPARDRIAGFAVHGSHLYVHDGPVLSRWNMIDRKCLSAINVLQPTQRYTGIGDVDWTALHKLPDTLRAKQQTIQRARRRMEWAALHEHAKQQYETWRTTPSRKPVLAQLDHMIEELHRLIGPGGVAGVRADLAKAIADGASLVISAPVVRAQQIWGKTAAMVFVLGRDATLHPLDDALKHMGTRRNERGAQPALTLAEFATDADSDEWACRLYYVADDGSVQALDGNALPPAVLPSWTTKGPAAIDCTLRPRVQDGVLWGGGALGTGVFALAVDRPTEPSAVNLPPGEWRWLEVRPEDTVFLASTDRESRLMSYDKTARIIDRWGKRAVVAPCFATFLPKSKAPVPAGRPLLVLEVDRDAPDAPAPLPFRVMVANTIDAPHSSAAAWYPPPPSVLFDGTLDAWGSSGGLAPRQVRTQPSVSKQDAYVIARDNSRAEQLLNLLTPSGPGSWRTHYLALMIKYPDPQASLGDMTLPPLAGRDAFFCYAIGNSITIDQAARATQTLDELRQLAQPVKLRIMSTESWAYLGDKKRNVNGPHPFGGAQVTLRFGNGTSATANTDGGGWIFLSPDKAGLTVTMDFSGDVTSCHLDRYGDNRIDLYTFRWE